MPGESVINRFIFSSLAIFALSLSVGIFGNNSGSAQPYLTAQVVQSGSLVARYAFEEGSGTAVADSLGTANATLVGGPTWVAGKVGTYAVSFNGTSQNGTIGYKSSGFFTRYTDHTTVTVAAWIKPNSLSAWQPVYQLGGCGNSIAIGLTDTGAVRFTIRKNGVQRVIDSQPLSQGQIGQWVHIAGVNSSTGTTLYVNGAEVSSVAGAFTWNTGDAVNMIGSSGTPESALQAPNSCSKPIEYFNGGIDELKIYDYALDSSDVATLAGTVAPPPAPSCTLTTSFTGSVSPSTVAPGGAYTISCDYGRTTNGINAQAGSGSCTFNNFIGTAAQFNCIAGSIAGTFTNGCVLSNVSPDNLCARTDAITPSTVTAPPPPPPPLPPPTTPPPTSSIGPNFYIDASKTDAPNCGISATTACKTYGYWFTNGCDANGCANNVVPGSIIHFAAGTYFGSGAGKEFGITFNGSISNPVTLQCDSPRSCIIDGTGVTPQTGCGFVQFGGTPNQTYCQANPTSYVRFTGFTVRNLPQGQAGISGHDNSQYIVVDNVLVDGAGNTGGALISTNSSANFYTVKHSTFTNCTTHSPSGCTWFSGNNFASVDNKMGPIINWPDPTCTQTGCNYDCHSVQNSNHVLIDGISARGCYDGIDTGQVTGQSTQNVITRFNDVSDMGPILVGDTGAARRFKMSGEARCSVSTNKDCSSSSDCPSGEMCVGIPMHDFILYKNILRYSPLSSNLLPDGRLSGWTSGAWFATAGGSPLDHADYWYNSSFSGSHIQGDGSTKDLSIQSALTAGNVFKAAFNLFDGISVQTDTPLGLSGSACTSVNCPWVGNGVWYEERGGNAQCVLYQPLDIASATYSCTQFGTTFNTIGANRRNFRADPHTAGRNAGGMNLADFKLTSLSSGYIDQGESFCTTSGASSGNTVNVTCQGSRNDPRFYFADPNNFYGLANNDCVGGTHIVDGVVSGCYDVQIEGCGVRQITSMTASSITFNGSSCSWASGAKVHIPWNGAAPDIGALEYSGASTVVPTPPPPAPTPTPPPPAPAPIPPPPTTTATSCDLPGSIPASGGVVNGSTSGASTLKAAACGTDVATATSNAPEKVYTWTPSTSGTATIKTCSTTGTNYDTVVYVRNANSCPLNTSDLACNDDTTGCGTTTDTTNPHRGSTITPTVTAGTTYYIVVDGYATNGLGSGNFSLTVTPPNTTTPPAPVPPPASTTFQQNDRVQTTSSLNVRSTYSATAPLVSGTPNPEPAGALGTILSSISQWADNFNWWNVSFDNGVTGWSVEDFLQKVTSTTPPPAPLPPPSTTPPASSTGAVYYVDPQSGNDTNAGTSQSAPWKTIPGTRNTGDTAFLRSSWGSGTGSITTTNKITCGNTIRIRAGSVFTSATGGAWLIDENYYATTCSLINPITIEIASGWGTGDVSLNATGITRTYSRTNGWSDHPAMVDIAVSGVIFRGQSAVSRFDMFGEGSLNGGPNTGRPHLFVVAAHNTKPNLNGFIGAYLKLHDSPNAFNIGLVNNWKVENSEGYNTAHGPWQAGLNSVHKTYNGAMIDVVGHDAGCGSSANPSCSTGGGNEDLFGLNDTATFWCIRCTAYNGGERGFNNGVIGDTTMGGNHIHRYRDIVGYNNGNGPTPCKASGPHFCSGAGIDVSGNLYQNSDTTYDFVLGARMWGNNSLGIGNYTQNIMEAWNASLYRNNIGRTDEGDFKFDTTSKGFLVFNSITQKVGLNADAFPGTAGNSNGTIQQKQFIPVTGNNCFRSYSSDTESLGSSSGGWPGKGSYATTTSWIGSTNKTKRTDCDPKFTALSTTSWTANDFSLQSGSTAIDAGRSYLLADGANAGNTITVKANGGSSDPRNYFVPKDGSAYPQPNLADTVIQIAGACGIRHVQSMTATTITFDGAACSWADNAMVHTPWNGAAPDMGALEYTGASTTLPPPPPPAPTPPPACTANFCPGDRVISGASELRSDPANSASSLGVLPFKMPGTILAGPVNTGGHEWYQVDFDWGSDGWTLGDVTASGAFMWKLNAFPLTATPTTLNTGSSVQAHWNLTSTSCLNTASYIELVDADSGTMQLTTQNIPASAPLQGSITFTPTQGGTYQFIFHCFNGATFTYSTLATSNRFLVSGNILSPPPVQTYGSVMMKRAGADLVLASAPAGSVVKLDGGATTASNPATFSSITAGSHTAYATNIAGYTETVGICTFPIGGAECYSPTFAIVPACDGSFCSVPITVSDSTVTKPVFIYTQDIATPTPTPPPPADTVAPIISNIGAGNISTNSATITWSTDEPSASQVEYGFSSTYGTVSNLNTMLTQSHSVALASLSSGATYHYRVISTDASGNRAVSLDKTFTTQALPDTQGPIAIANLSSSGVTQTSFVLTWAAPQDLPQGQAASYDIRYSMQPLSESAWASAIQVSGEPVPGAPGSSESYTLAGLTVGTTYYIAIKSADVAGNVSLISNVVMGETSPLPTSSQPGSTGGTTSPQPSGGIGGGGGGGVTDITPPGKPQNIRILGAPDQIVIDWQNPSDTDFVRTVVVRKEGTSPTSPSDGAVIYEGTGQEYIDTKLERGKTYYYALFSYDRNINYSQAAFSSSYLGKNTEQEIMQQLSSSGASQQQTGGLSIGSRITVIDNVYVRQSAGGKSLGVQRRGRMGTIVAGSASATVGGKSYSYWNVDFDSGVDGWSAEEYFTKSTATVQQSSKTFSIGASVTVKDNVNVRQSAGGTVLGVQRAGNTGTIIAGPATTTIGSTSYTYWSVNYDSGADGWSAEEYFE